MDLAARQNWGAVSDWHQWVMSQSGTHLQQPQCPVSTQAAHSLDQLARDRSGAGLRTLQASKRREPLLTRGSRWQSRPGSNWRFRLERPVRYVVTTSRLPGETYSDLAIRGLRSQYPYPSLPIVSQPLEGQVRDRKA